MVFNRKNRNHLCASAHHFPASMLYCHYSTELGNEDDRFMTKSGLEIEVQDSSRLVPGTSISH